MTHLLKTKLIGFEMSYESHQTEFMAEYMPALNFIFKDNRLLVGERELNVDMVEDLIDNINSFLDNADQDDADSIHVKAFYLTNDAKYSLIDHVGHYDTAPGAVMILADVMKDVERHYNNCRVEK